MTDGGEGVYFGNKSKEYLKPYLGFIYRGIEGASKRIEKLNIPYFFFLFLERSNFSLLSVFVDSTTVTVRIEGPNREFRIGDAGFSTIRCRSLTYSVLAHVIHEGNAVRYYFRIYKWSSIQITD